jgi:membrane-associated phospholipid phosphatase
MKYIRNFLVSLMALLVLAGNLHAEEKGSLIGKALGNLAEDYKYLATSPTRLDVRSTLITLGLIGLGGVLYAEDEQIRDFFQNNQTSFQDNVAYGAEKLGYQYALVAVALYGGSGYLLKNEKMQETGLLAIESFLVANSISVPLKFGIGRARPKRDRGAYSYQPFSFSMSDTAIPSGHAVSAFSMASVFAGEYDSPWVGVLAYSLACLVGWERLYDDRHWASDVLAGAVLGTVVGRSVVYLHKTTDDAVSLVPLVDPSAETYGLMVQLRF